MAEKTCIVAISRKEAPTSAIKKAFKSSFLSRGQLRTENSFVQRTTKITLKTNQVQKK